MQKSRIGIQETGVFRVGRKEDGFMDVKDNADFEVFYETYFPQVVGYIRKRVGNLDTAEDMAEDCFLACYKARDRYDPDKASPGTWLYTVVNNRLKNYYRDKKDIDEIPETVASEDRFEDEVEEAGYIGWLRDELADGLMLLNEIDRKIVILRYFYNKTSEQIGDETGLSAVNVRVRLKRSLHKLSERFEHII